MKRVILFAACAAIAAGSAALADPGHGDGQGRHGGPPGLADKPYGMPPGQAKKMWRPGERMPPPYLAEPRYQIAHPERYRLPPPPMGFRWVLVDQDACLVRSRDGRIAAIVRNALADLTR